MGSQLPDAFHLRGEQKAYGLICETLDEEESADKKLTRAAKSVLNMKAMS